MATVELAPADPPPLELESVQVEREHQTLVDRGAQWLRRKGCKLVLREFVAAYEIPDVIGWRGTWGTSYLIECKTSRGDFLKDRHKPWRRDPDSGMGAYRYFLCRPGLIKPEELPTGWGLLYAHPKVITIEAGKDPARYDAPAGFGFKRSHEQETRMLLSALNRLRLDHGDDAFDRAVHMTYSEKQAAKEQPT